MSWTLARLNTACGHCGAPIGSGEAFYAGDLTPTRWCAACALRELGHAQPEVIAAPTSRPWTPPKPKPRGLELIAGRDITQRMLGERVE